MFVNFFKRVAFTPLEIMTRHDPTLEGIPPELRKMIFQLALVETEPIQTAYEGFAYRRYINPRHPHIPYIVTTPLCLSYWKSSNLPAILFDPGKSASAVTLEAREVYFRENVFALPYEGPDRFVKWTRGLGVEQWVEKILLLPRMSGYITSRDPWELLFLGLLHFQNLRQLEIRPVGGTYLRYAMQVFSMLLMLSNSRNRSIVFRLG